MRSWLLEMLQVFRLYFAVEMVFAVWGLAGGCAIFVGGLNYELGFGIAVVGGFLTAIPVWSYLSQMPKEAAPVLTVAGPATAATLIPLAATMLITVYAATSQPAAVASPVVSVTTTSIPVTSVRTTATAA